MMRTPSLIKAKALLIFVLACALPTLVFAQSGGDGGQASGAVDHSQHDHDTPELNYLSPIARTALQELSIQDFQGRMKPLDTLSREMVIKITKRGKFEDWEPVDLYLSWAAHKAYWYNQPVISVRDPKIKEFLGIDAATRRVSAASLLDERGQYRLSGEVDEAHRTADRSRSKYQRHLLTFDERVNLLFMSLQQGTLRIYPLPGDPGNTWLTLEGVAEKLSTDPINEYVAANRQLFDGIIHKDDAMIRSAAAEHARLQERFGSEVLISDAARSSELLLNRFDPFTRLIFPYLIIAGILLLAYVVGLVKRDGESYNFRNPLYLIGSILFWVTLLAHTGAFVLRWVASGRAPLSNGYESLIWIGLMVGLAGFIFELIDRKGIAAGLAAMLTAIILGVALMAAFNPAIGPLVPVLASVWLNIHVTVITSSYGFLGLSALIALTMLILHIFKGPGRETIRDAIVTLYDMHWKVLLSGLGLLSIGTFLGGIWANESWGRYWGWDSKETWSLVTILVYAAVSHFRYLPSLATPWAMAAGSFVAIASVMMTYFGVNYFLAGLHSYAAGSAATVPGWVNIAVGIMVLILIVSWWRDRHGTWEKSAKA